MTLCSCKRRDRAFSVEADPAFEPTFIHTRLRHASSPLLSTSTTKFSSFPNRKRLVHDTPDNRRVWR